MVTNFLFFRDLKHFYQSLTGILESITEKTAPPGDNCVSSFRKLAAPLLALRALNADAMS